MERILQLDPALARERVPLPERPGLGEPPQGSGSRGAGWRGDLGEG
jgi:hypothetical protein